MEETAACGIVPSRERLGSGWIETQERPSFFVPTTQVVETSLSNCPSDIVALSLFLWCARQPQYSHGPGSFDLMVGVVDRLTNRFGSVSGILKELESVGCPRKPQIFLMLMRIYWRGGMHKLVLETFDEMSAHNYVPNVFARNIALDTLHSVSQFLTFSIAIGNLCELDDWLGARAVLRLMVKQRFDPDVGTLSRVLICLEKSTRLMEVLQLVGFMVVSGKQLSVPIWTILIGTFCQLGRAEYASELLGKMADSGCSPTVITYTTVIKGLLECQLSDEAFHLLDLMLSNGYQPDLVLCNVLVDFLCKSKRYDDAIGVILCLQEWNLKPDSYTLSSMMRILCAYGKIELIPKLIAAFGIPVDLVACWFPYKAVEFYDDMVDRGFIPDNFSFAGLLNGLCRSGRVDDAVKVYTGILLNGNSVDAHVHTVVFNGLIKGGKAHTAIRLFRKAVSENFALTWSEEGCSLLSEMKQLGWEPGMPTYSMMLRGLFRARKFGAIRSLVKSMADSGSGTMLQSIQYND
ncbi:unnamed protein product [Spirodela intermedia]|uniref:Uncharacterized protein n=1 Tax=Spirodela intermedia TaxID=51605 RepID=A0A7I8JI60_SPIIN|nr:unnamed protein product [Spirodela intermedia]CAA6669611.1 unnamed protein product [Spirodela intermedia]